MCPIGDKWEYCWLPSSDPSYNLTGVISVKRNQWNFYIPKDVSLIPRRKFKKEVGAEESGSQDDLGAFLSEKPSAKMVK